LNSDKKRIVELEAKVVRLESLVEKLLDKINDLTNRKNSCNSSVLLSKNENWPLKTNSLRVNQGKKVGGQPGHEDSTLEMVENLDIVIEHKPDFCNQCG
jgi:transposase